MTVSVTGLRSVQFANADEISFSMDGLISITVFENEGEIFTALVAEENVEEYTYRLENEEGYRESQIAMVRSSNGVQTRCPPPPFSSSYRLSSTAFMDREDILANIDIAEENLVEFNYLLSLANTGLLINFFKTTPVGTFVSLYATVLGFGSSLVQLKIDSYKNIAARILSGEIKALCCCIYVNTGSEYPKAWSYETIVYN